MIYNVDIVIEVVDI